MTQGTLSLIICTYNRSHALRVLLESILGQVLAPYEIIVVDGSTNTESASVSDLFRAKLNLRYFLVEPEFRGLTRQRNFGLSQVSDQAELIAFLDDDVCLDALYFEELVKTFTMYPSYKPFSVKRFISINTTNDKIDLLFASENSIRSFSVDVEGNVANERSVSLITETDDEEKVKRSSSNLTHWFDNYFIASGYQTIKNSDEKIGNKKRSIFFINKITYE